MIHSLDTYVYDHVGSKLQAILQNPAIIEEALKNIDQESKERFIKTYCGTKPKKPVDVRFSFPPGKEQFNAGYVVELGDGRENKSSIGGIQGTFDYKEVGSEVFVGIVEDRGTHLEIVVPHPIGELTNIEEVSFVAEDNVQYESNRITFNKQGNEWLVGMKVTVHYSSKDESVTDFVGAQKGFTSLEKVYVTPFSTNRDTARCLDAILKVILITMRESEEEKNMYALQDAQFGPMQVLISDADMQVHGRPLTLTYTVTHSISYNFTRKLEALIIKNRGG